MLAERLGRREGRGGEGRGTGELVSTTIGDPSLD